MNPEPGDYNFQLEDPVEKGLKWMLLLGRLIGVSPISVSLRSGANGSGKLSFRWRFPSSIHSLLLTITLSIVVATIIWSFLENFGTYSNILEEMTKLEDTIYWISILAVYIYWLRNAPNILHIFCLWFSTNHTLDLKVKDKEFPRFCVKIAVILLGSSVLETVLYNVYLVQIEGSTHDKEFLIEKIYNVNAGPFSTFVPYWSPITSIPLIYTITTSHFAGSFANIFLIVLCRAISFMFEQISEEMKTTVGELHSVFDQLQNGSIIELPVKVYVVQARLDRENRRKEAIWIKIRENVLALCDLAEEISKFVAPLVLLCYIHNILFVILQGVRLLYEPETGTSSYVYVSTAQFSLRVILVTYFASKIYHSTENVLKSLEHFPDAIFSPSAYRLQRMLCRHPAKVTLLGTVPISRYIFVSMLTFMFTAGIILMQAMSTVKARQGSDFNCSSCIREFLFGLKLGDRVLVNN